MSGDLIGRDDALACLSLGRTVTSMALAINAIPAAMPQENLDLLVKAERLRMMDWCAKRQAVSQNAWERAARKALAGDMAALRNRLNMIDACPLNITLSQDEPTQEPQP